MNKISTFVIATIVSVSAAAGTDISHPSLLFTPQRVELAQQNARQYPAYAQGLDNIIDIANRQAEAKNPDLLKLEYPALAWQLTGKTKYADALVRALEKAADTQSWANAEMMARNPAWHSELQMAHRAYQLAIAYDAVYDRLTPSQRQHIARGLYRLAVEPLMADWLNDSTRIHSLNSMGHNWWTACTAMGGMLALALSNELPQAAVDARAAVDALPQWFDFAGDPLQHKPANFDPTGGMYESINYASFGITQALLLRMAWLNSHPNDSLPQIEQMARIAPFFCHVAYPRHGQLYSINFGDSHKNVTGESSMLLAYAMGHENPETLWYASQIEPGQHREGFPLTTPMGLLYTPVGTVPGEPDLPTSHLWPSFGWATMRNSWQKDATMLAVKSGATWNHSHADANSFILFHKGIDIVKDAGNCSYSKPQYRDYFFQSPAHNVVLFDGQGQKTYQQYHGASLPGSVHSLLDAANVRYVMADGTGPMSHALDRNQRHFLWLDSIILIVDDLHAHRPGQFTWLWHPGAPARKNGYDIEIANDSAAVAIRPLFPRTLAFSDYVHDYPDDLYWEIVEAPAEDLTHTEPYYALHLPGNTDRVKALTAIILKDSPADKNIPVIERREGKDWIGLRITHNDKITDLYINQLADGRLMHLNSWINADGWDTDAYMLAVTYPSGASPLEPERLAVIYGSSLRRDTDVWFSSLSKLNLVAAHTPQVIDITANGQPGLRFKYRACAPHITLNGSLQPAVATTCNLFEIQQ